MESRKYETLPIKIPINYRKMRVHMGGCECQLTWDVLVSSWSLFGGGGFKSESESFESGENVYSGLQMVSITSSIKA